MTNDPLSEMANSIGVTNWNGIRVRSTRQFSNVTGIFEKGTEFVIISCSKLGFGLATTQEKTRWVHCIPPTWIEPIDI